MLLMKIYFSVELFKSRAKHFKFFLHCNGIMKHTIHGGRKSTMYWKYSLIFYLNTLINEAAKVLAVGLSNE